MSGQIKDAIKVAYEDSDYKDVVSEVAKGTFVAEKYKFPIVPVAIVAGVVVLAVIGMVIFTGEKEDEVVEVKKEVKEIKEEVKKEAPKKVETAKKVPAKKTTTTKKTTPAKKNNKK